MNQAAERSLSTVGDFLDKLANRGVVLDRFTASMVLKNTDETDQFSWYAAMLFTF